jgi:uncharacterized phage protein (TIGR01671 family)
MREIKFRAWDKKDNVMMYDVYMRRVNMKLIDFKRSLEGVRWTVNIECDDIILMQYTNLKDSSNPPKEIYEGDIVEIEYYSDLSLTATLSSLIVRTVCEYGEDASFHLKDNIGRLYAVRYSGSAIKRKEVIGNIWENPELLEEK